ncbi:MAG: hypothetical protein LBL61_00375 [Elusimicrobiota bacterium]|jgi:hypothetical protein|nr:hypothetical protein [Elusimicrobiota bacterium]
MLAAFFAVQAATYLQSGKILDFATIMRAQKLFYETGFFMLPMEPGHGWLLPIIVYALALIKSFNLLPFLKEKDAYFTPPRAALYFVFAFIGLGIFIYYQGRSHPMTLQGVVFPAVCLLAFFAQEYLDKLHATAQNDIFRRIWAYRVCVIAAFFIFYGGVGVALLCGPMPARIRTDMRSSTEALMIKQAVDLIRQRAGERKKDIIALPSSVLYSELGEVDTLPFPVSIDWILKSDYKKIYSYLASSENLLVLDKNTALTLNYYQEDDEFTKILGRYKRTAANGEFFIFEKQGQ